MPKAVQAEIKNANNINSRSSIAVPTVAVRKRLFFIYWILDDWIV